MPLTSPAGRVSFHLHRRYLQRYVEAGNHVLEVVAGNEDALRVIEASSEAWYAFLRWETAFCEEPGILDSGAHIIAVVRKA